MVLNDQQLQQLGNALGNNKAVTEGPPEQLHSSVPPTPHHTLFTFQNITIGLLAVILLISLITAITLLHRTKLRDSKIA